MRFKKSLFLALILSVAALPAQAGLVAYYTFDNEDAADTSGNSNNGSLGLNTAFSAVDVPAAIGGGRSAVADGTNASIISVANTTSLESITVNLTVSLWIKAVAVDNDNWVRFMRKGDEETNQGTPAWMLNRDSDTDNAYIRIDSEPAGFNQNRGSGGSVLTGGWVHLAYTLDSGSVKEYINGSETVIANAAYNNASLSNTGALTLLGRSGGVLDGLMDDVSIWNETLTAQQIGQLASGASALSLIPEPSSAMLLLLGSVSLLRRRR